MGEAEACSMLSPFFLMLYLCLCWSFPLKVIGTKVCITSRLSLALWWRWSAKQTCPLWLFFFILLHFQVAVVFSSSSESRSVGVEVVESC